MKRKYDNSIPKILLENDYLSLGSVAPTKQLYINPIKNIILYYTKADVKSKRQNAFNELINLNNMYTIGCNHQYQLIYGYLCTRGAQSEAQNSSEDATESLVLLNVQINIMSGELLLRHVLDNNYNNVISTISQEINQSFAPINTPVLEDDKSNCK